MAGREYTIQQLKPIITGEVLLAGSPAYEQSRRVLFAKGAPAVVVLPKTPQDITQALAFARTNKLAVSVRNGGHSAAGHSTNNGGVVIDMRHFNAIEVVNDKKHMVRIGAGATWEMVARALQPHGWAVSSGDTKSVGVAGLTLLGGLGWMVRRDGLAIDSLVAAELVMADGRLLHASNTVNPDLFWAIRGGGGNFGVAVSFDFVAHPAEYVFAGTVTYSKKDLPAMLRRWRDYMRTAPNELTSMFFIMPAFGGMPPSVMVRLCYVGGEQEAVMNALEPLLNLGPVIRKDIGRKAYAELLEDVRPPEHMKIIANNAFVQTLSDELIDVISSCSDTNQMIQLRSLGGAMNGVARNDTAFAHRDSEVLIVMPAFVPPDASQADIDKALAPWRQIERFSHGVYCGLSSEDTPEVVAAAYPGDVYARLADVKKKYDPQNVFSRNYNVKPAI